MEETSWSVFCQRIQGPKHAQRGQDSQDAVASHQPQSPSLPLAMAVADGHGSARYIRSGRGSAIATELAIEQLLQLETSSRNATLTDIKRAATEQLPRKLHRSWRARVIEDLVAEPLSDDERYRLLQSSGVRERDLETRPEFMYGTTLLAVLLTPRYAIFVQIGDGDLVVAWPTSVAGNVFPSDDSQLGDQTRSLSSANAWRHVQVLFQPLINDFPLLVLASTDGYGKAFRTQNDFIQVAEDLKQMVLLEGSSVVGDNLASWLREAAELSGDDATAAIAVPVMVAPEAHLEIDDREPDESATAPDGLPLDRVEQQDTHVATNRAQPEVAKSATTPADQSPDTSIDFEDNPLPIDSNMETADDEDLE